MRATLLIFFIALFISCDNKIKEPNNGIEKPQPAPDIGENIFTKQLREHIEELTPAINKAIGLPTLIYKPGTITDTSMLEEFRVTLLQGGHSFTYIPNYLFRIYSTKYTRKYTFETYSFHDNGYIIDSVKQICSIPLTRWEVDSFYMLLTSNALNDHIEYTNYSTTAGAHAVYE